ncbi:major capsid protein [Mycolicibacterium baixiangningiae]|uniref:major capsid protein n=1 Tax=Mycolicibacterium baixiangningiae TaxID=2761578 RepID=UPI001867E66A|nr:major capsid protein [Mycolicibacterium baixiangningiae]
MPNALLPKLNGRELTVDVALRTPSVIAARIAKLADDQLLLPQFTHQLGAAVQGGGMLYSTVTAANYYTRDDVEQRAPGSQYRETAGVDPTPQLAAVEDWGAKVQVPDEYIIRNNVSYMDQQTTQLANTIARKLDERLLAKLSEAFNDGSNTVPGNSWLDLVTVGDPATLTPSAALPSADLAAAQLAADMQELGVKHDLLVVHPQEAFALKVAYADKLDDMLKSAGVSLFTNPRLTAGTAFALQKGTVGTVGFEIGLTVDVIDDRHTRSKWVQAYVVPAIAIDRIQAAKKLTGLAS